jgi:hypothetical protein
MLKDRTAISQPMPLSLPKTAANCIRRVTMTVKG